MRAGCRRESQLAAARRIPQNVVATWRWRGECRRNRRPHARTGTRRGGADADERTDEYPTACRLRAAGPCRTAARRATAAAATKRTTSARRTIRRIDSRGAAFFFSLRHKEALIMAKHRGRGVATINYPIGMNLGGDPSQALVHSNPSGKFTVALSSIDLGQGMKSVTRQICAETLGVPVEDVYVDTADSDTGPHCMGSFASRGTHRVGNAVMVAAREARAVMMEAAAEELEVDPADLETDGRGSIQVKGAPHRSISVRDVAIAAQFRQGKTISGRGIFLVPLSDVDPETGEMSPATCYAHACLIAEVEVDDETGDVAVLKMTSAYEIGRAINPKLVEQQLVGGSWMGMSHALYETPEPYYPDPRNGPRDFNEYLMPGPGDICPHDILVLERPAPDGPFGAKGPGEMCANPVLPAVANAVFAAVGVRINDLPITPEKILRALKARGGAATAARAR
jgi:CO/xanthine dehydrogenase Mo-binding subunit